MSKYCCFKKKYNPIPSHCFTIPIRCNPISCFVPATNNALIAQCDPQPTHTFRPFSTQPFCPHRSRAQCSSGCMQQSLFPRPAPPLRDIFIFYPKKSWLLKTVTNTFGVSARDNDRAAGPWGTVNVCTEKLILHHPISDSSSCQVVMFSFNKLRFCPADGQ